MRPFIPSCAPLCPAALSLLFGLWLVGVPVLAQPEADHAPCRHPYAVDGSLTEAEAQDLIWLAWPQTREGITDRFGLPLHFDAAADYYAVEERPSQYLRVSYQGTQATDADFVDRNCSY